MRIARFGDAGTGNIAYGDWMTPAEMQYAQAVDQQIPGLSSQVAAQALPGEGFIDSLARVVSTLSLADAQRKLLNVQVQRAQQGLPPLDASQYSLGMNVGLTPTTQRALMIGGALVLAAFLLPALLRAISGGRK